MSLKDFQDRGSDGYVSFGLGMTPEKTKEVAERSAQSAKEEHRYITDARYKTARTILRTLGYDPKWVSDEFMPKFSSALKKNSRKK